MLGLLAPALVVAPFVDHAERFRDPCGFITAKLEMEHVPEADPLVETDDMRRVDFACHANEPVKVVCAWLSQTRLASEHLYIPIAW